MVALRATTACLLRPGAPPLSCRGHPPGEMEQRARCLEERGGGARPHDAELEKGMGMWLGPERAGVWQDAGPSWGPSCQWVPCASSWPTERFCFLNPHPFPWGQFLEESAQVGVLTGNRSQPGPAGSGARPPWPSRPQNLAHAGIPPMGPWTPRGTHGMGTLGPSIPPGTQRLHCSFRKAVPRTPSSHQEAMLTMLPPATQPGGPRVVSCSCQLDVPSGLRRGHGDPSGPVTAA